ncbi:MAG TPA: hypothetical protein VMV47_03610 [Bacteroidales bacterium]|nr:hypothetical protein [Bacteroidales bacterium]
MRRLLFTFILFSAMAIAINAQDYNTGVGLRGGTAWGLTVKHFVSQKNAFEGFLYAYQHGFNVTGLYEIHNKAFDVDNLRWYFGFGAHVGSYDEADIHDFVLGPDGVIGIEYSFTEAPINIGLDWNPYFNIIGNEGFKPASGAISIRYIF